MQDTATRTATAPPDDPVRVALEDDAVRAKLLAQARAITRRAPVECEDLVQTALQRAWAKRAEYDPDAGSVTTWLAGFVRHVTRELARKRTPGSATEGQIESVVETEQPNELELAETRDLARRLLASLPEPFRTAVEARMIEERDYDTIAERLGTSPTNVRQLVSRGINKLKALAEQEDRS